jgi:hypothetical protein
MQLGQYLAVNHVLHEMTIARLKLSEAKMVGKRSPFTDQIRSFIKSRRILGIQAKLINQICRVYRNNEIFFSSVTRWCKKCKSGVDSVNNAPHARRPKTATSPKMVEKAKVSIATDLQNKVYS